MNILKEFPSDYITGVDVEAARRDNKAAILTIKGVMKGECRDPKSGRMVLRPELTFQATPKKLRLNPSSIKLMVRAWGAETDAWIGQAVELSLMSCNLKDKLTGEPVLGVLARPAKTQAKQATEPPAGDDLGYDGEVPQA